MGDLSPQAQKRLSMIEFYYQVKDITVVSRLFKVSRKTLYQWLVHFKNSGKRLKIIHIYTRIKTPKDNAIDERFNRTIQEEFMETDEYFEPLLTESDLTAANQRLTEWLIFYNLKRTHQSLNYKTSLQWYNQNYQLMRVLPMYPTYTPI